MTSLRTKLASHHEAGATSALILVVWRERKKNPRQLFDMSVAIGQALGRSRPATYCEMMQWYADHGASRDGELLDRMGVGS